MYEVVLLFGLLLVPAFFRVMLDVLGVRPSPLFGTYALQAFSILFLAVYFTWFWSTRGQTLPMQTWRIRLVRADGGPVGPGRALLRYAAAFVGYLGPAWVVTQVFDVRGGQQIALSVAGVVCWALLARVDRERQFWHDRLCGTRLVDVRGEPPRRAATG